MRVSRGVGCLALAVALALALQGAGAKRPRPAASKSAAPAPTATASRAAGAASMGASATDLAQWCRRLSGAVPGLAQPGCQDSGLAAGDGRSVRGVPLWSRDVLPPGRPAKFRVLLLGGIHGDELDRKSVV